MIPFRKIGRASQKVMPLLSASRIFLIKGIWSKYSTFRPLYELVAWEETYPFRRKFQRSFLRLNGPVQG
jgi:hypothetical protein